MKKLSILLFLTILLTSKLSFAGAFIQGGLGYASTAGYGKPNIDNFIKLDNISGANFNIGVGYQTSNNFDILLDLGGGSGTTSKNITTTNAKNRHFSLDYNNINIGLSVLRHQGITNNFFINAGLGIGILRSGITYSSNWNENDATGKPVEKCLGTNCINSVYSQQSSVNDTQFIGSLLIGAEYKFTNNLSGIVNYSYSYGFKKYNSNNINRNLILLGARVYL